MNNAKDIWLNVDQATISVTIQHSTQKLVMEATKAQTILQFIRGLCSSLHVTFEGKTCVAWLQDLPKLHVTQVLIRDPHKTALLKTGKQNDRINVRKLVELSYMNELNFLYLGEAVIRTLKKLARS